MTDVTFHPLTPDRWHDFVVNFLDRCKVHVKSGIGGNGCVSFRREDAQAWTP